MNTSSTLRLPGFFPHWAGLLTLSLVIMAGLLGMHMIGGAQAASMSPMAQASPMAPMAQASPMAPMAQASPASSMAPASQAHRATQPAMSIADHAKVPDASNHLDSATVCACSPSGCEMLMASHGSCIPAVGAATPAAPQPGLAPDPSAGPTSSDRAGYKFIGRLLDPPSLTQLSISRT
ncbi:hypothetical protein [Arthrobacter cryoconiti]|uniref:Uncharacterized protein n=1 Tax=Arthrobacter cryoconiti TaxID=748907 RepID=A0ABV8R792_9MICC|nr:hypothetical protein [Arthrobacter cryoconiti]MCC9066762.1 hypothetical protein [Arthrobacter cryoconiti]